MSLIKKLTSEQLEAFDACDTMEEMIAKAKELGIECAEEELAEIFNADNELGDDEIDEVAGGAGEGERGWHKGYKRVWRRDDCTIG